MNQNESKRTKIAVAVENTFVALCVMVALVVALSTARGLSVSPIPSKAGFYPYAGQGDLVLSAYVKAAWADSDEASEWHFHQLTKREHIGMTAMASLICLGLIVLIKCIK